MVRISPPPVQSQVRTSPRFGTGDQVSPRVPQTCCVKFCTSLPLCGVRVPVATAVLGHHPPLPSNDPSGRYGGNQFFANCPACDAHALDGASLFPHHQVIGIAA